MKSGWLVKKILSRKQEDNHFHQGIIENTKNEIIDNLRKWHNKLYDDDPIERKTVVIVIPKHPNHRKRCFSIRRYFAKTFTSSSHLNN